MKELHMKRLMSQEVPSLYQAALKAKNGILTVNLMASKISVNEGIGVFLVMEMADTPKEH